VATVTGTASFTIAALTLGATASASAASTYRLACVVGGSALTGQAASMWYQPATSNAGGQVTMTVTAIATGSCSVVVTCGNATASAPLTVSSGYTLPADVRTYALSGIASGGLTGRLVPSAAGSFTETGIAATFPRTYKYTVGPAQSFTLGATSTGLVRIGGYVLPTDTSAAQLTAPATALRAVRATTGATASLTLTGVAATVRAQYRVEAPATAVAATRPDVTLIRSARLIAAAADGFQVFGSAAGPAVTPRRATQTGAVALTGQEVTLTEGVSGSTVMPATTCEYEANGVAASFTYSGAVTAAVVRRRRIVAGGIR
jgi:hypothetical protein